VVAGGLSGIWDDSFTPGVRRKNFAVCTYGIIYFVAVLGIAFSVPPHLPTVMPQSPLGPLLCRVYQMSIKLYL
jgi:hypothetical protein